MAITNEAKAFCEYIERRYKGKVYSIERVYDPNTYTDMVVKLELRLPVGLDEIEVFRRINKVLEAVIEGKEE